jgi:chromosome partitioning protein
MRTIAIVNEKGGTGKTTTAVNLAAAMGELGHRVLLVDLDGQGASSRWLGVEDDNRLADALLSGESLEPIPDVLPGVALAPGTGKLDSVAHDLRPTQGGQLRKVLAKLSSLYEYTLIDCPPSLGNRLIGNALLASTHVIVPVETSILALDGLKILLTTLEDVREGFSHEIALAGVLACRYDGRTRLSKLVLDELRRALPGKVFGTVIRENVRMRECPASGQSIMAFAPESHAAEDYMALGREVLDLFDREAAMPSAVDALKADLATTTFNLDHLRENASASVREAAARRQGRSRADEPAMHTGAQWRNDGVVEVDEDEAPSEAEWATVGSPAAEPLEAAGPVEAAAAAFEQDDAPALALSAPASPSLASVLPRAEAPEPLEAAGPVEVAAAAFEQDDAPVPALFAPASPSLASVLPRAEAPEPLEAAGPVEAAAAAFEQDDAPAIVPPAPVPAPRSEGDYPALRAMLKELQQQPGASRPSADKTPHDCGGEKHRSGLLARIFVGK